MANNPSGIEVDFRRNGRPGKGTLSIQLNGQPIYVNDLIITDADQREQAIQQVCADKPGIDARKLREKLLGFATDDGGQSRADSQATALVELADDAELFHTPGDNAAYATIPMDGHKETWAINGKEFKQWLCRRFWQECGKAPGTQVKQDALGVITSKALFDGPSFPVAVRLARHEDALYLDLSDSEWRAVKITPAGWQVVADPPVRFLRRKGQFALPLPVAGGSLDELRPLVNVGDDANWALVLAWLVATVRDRGPYPILAVNGEQGSAKSTLCRMLRLLVDPNKADLRAEPKEIGDLMIAANNNWVLAFDNISHIQPWLSDAMCRLATGGGFGKRELYSDDDEKLFDAMRPILLNGIEDLATRSDLLDRCLCITLPVIPESQRRTEAELWQSFYEARPRLLGALLDAVCAAMRTAPTVKLAKLPRMADFATWAVAAESGLGLAPEAILSAYTGNRQSANELAIEASAIGPALLSFMEDHGTWEGTAKDLLAQVSSDTHSDMDLRRHYDWPRTSHKLANLLRRLAPNLRKVGVEVSFTAQRTNRGRKIVLERTSIWTSSFDPNDVDVPLPS